MSDVGGRGGGRQTLDPGRGSAGDASTGDRSYRRTFASDNFAGVHPEVVEGILRANVGHATSYGDDPVTSEAEGLFREHFAENAHVFLTFNGTGANVVGLQSMLRPFEAVICSANSHIYVDECGAPERFLGSKLVPIATPDGKLTPELVEVAMVGIGDEHRVQPRVVSLTESTELGTCYSVEELTLLAQWAHERGMLLHLDGARLSNAAAHLGVGFDVFAGAGVDVLSFGGTKNGAMAAEAVVSFLPSAEKQLKYIRKQSMQLSSKMRFVAAQFIALLSHDLWRRNASHANAMALRLGEGAAQVTGVQIVQPVEANGVFASLPRKAIELVQGEFPFYVWEGGKGPRDVVRWMASFDTTPEDVDAFIRSLTHAMAVTRPA
ncbi:MAG: low specificity L-threonine aldolase [Acidimicrobiales bacterium]